MTVKMHPEEEENLLDEFRMSEKTFQLRWHFRHCHDIEALHDIHSNGPTRQER